MRNRANAFAVVGAVAVLQLLLPVAPLAADEAARPHRQDRQAGEDRWVVSLAITSGVIAQEQHGSASSFLLEGNNPNPVPLQDAIDGDDVAVSVFVGGSLELMTPALPIPTRPRLFLSGEILPAFGPDRDLALDGAPGCIRGPEPGFPCASEEDGLIPPGHRPFDGTPKVWKNSGVIIAQSTRRVEPASPTMNETSLNMESDSKASSPRRS